MQSIDFIAAYEHRTRNDLVIEKKQKTIECTIIQFNCKLIIISKYY